VVHSGNATVAQPWIKAQVNDRAAEWESTSRKPNRSNGENPDRSSRTSLIPGKFTIAVASWTVQPTELKRVKSRRMAAVAGSGTEAVLAALASRARNHKKSEFCP
jgi:hypothetical protein